MGWLCSRWFCRPISGICAFLGNGVSHFFWQHERFSTPLDLVRETEEATTCGGFKYFQEDSKKSKTRSHYRRLDKALIMCIIRV